jgi:hypothetical protein
MIGVSGTLSLLLRKLAGPASPDLVRHLLADA